MSKIYVSENANLILKSYLKSLGHQLALVYATDLVYSAVSAHPDIYMCKMGADKKASIFIGDKSQLGFKYPANVKFNAVCLGKYFFHNLKYTSPILIQEVQELGLEIINVKQGYTKCNTVVVDEGAIITSDTSILKALKSYPIEVLHIQPGHVNLSDFPYGFLGGASGKVGNEIIFNGNLEAHPDFNQIKEFIESRGLTAKYFTEYTLEDIGSIIEA
jgi:hypothetical protein